MNKPLYKMTREELEIISNSEDEDLANKALDILDKIEEEDRKVYRFGAHVATIRGRNHEFNGTSMFQIDCTNGNTLYNFTSISEAKEFCRINPDELI